ncbi:hypothetical protein B0H14DRAFT_2619965 [Mycena olivaceomarginata]|nr:hypothetical protein B0H14DRAFT_2619965 [Mycena olivaceomarginata]
MSTISKEKGQNPVEGLFPFSFSSTSVSSTPHPTSTSVPSVTPWVPLPLLVSVDKDAADKDNEDAWVDEDDDSEEGEGEGDEDDEGEDEYGEMIVVDDQERKGEGDELPTALPLCHLRSQLTPPVYNKERQTPVLYLYKGGNTDTIFKQGGWGKRKGMSFMAQAKDNRAITL